MARKLKFLIVEDSLSTVRQSLDEVNFKKNKNKTWYNN